jgi:hypothetical protein
MEIASRSVGREKQGVSLALNRGDAPPKDSIPGFIQAVAGGVLGWLVIQLGEALGSETWACALSEEASKVYIIGQPGK